MEKLDQVKTARAVLDLCEVAANKCKINIAEQNKPMSLKLNEEQLSKLSFIIDSTLKQVFNNSIETVIGYTKD